MAGEGNIGQPFDFIPGRLRKPLFLAALLWTLGLFAVMQVLNQPLLTPAAPAGIVSLELAGTPQRAVDILTSWAAQSLPSIPSNSNLALLSAAFGLGLDYLFMPSYAVALALGALLAARRHRGWFASLGTWVGWASLICPLFDGVENVALWSILQGFPRALYSALWPQLAFWCASTKFALIIVGCVYMLLGASLPKSK